MVSLNLLGVTLSFASIALAATNSSSTPTSACTTVITSLVPPEPTLCGCPSQDALQDLIDAESNVSDSIDKILDIMQDADIDTTEIEKILNAVEKDLAGLLNVVNGAGCIATTFVPLLSNVIQAVVQVITLVINALTANISGSLSEITSIIQSIVKAIGSVVDAVKTILGDRDVAKCFVCQDISTINNLINTLETAVCHIIPFFPDLPKLPGCVPSVTTLITAEVPCAVATAHAFAFAVYDSNATASYCSTTFTTALPPAVTDICECKENSIINTLVGILNGVISTIRHLLAIIPPLPGALNDIKNKILPGALDDLTKILNAVLGVGCIGASSGVVVDALGSLISAIKQALDLIKNIVGTDLSNSINSVIGVLTILINAINTLIDNIWSVFNSESFGCFVCADISAINDLIADLNKVLASIPLLKDITIHRLPQCDVATAVTTLIPCATPTA